MKRLKPALRCAYLALVLGSLCLGGCQPAQTGNAPESGSPPMAASPATDTTRFELYAENCAHSIESYQLPAGWQGFGKATFTPDPSGNNVMSWFSGFISDTGAVGFIDSPTTLTFPGPVNEIPFITDPKVLAEAVIVDLKSRLQVDEIKIESATVKESQSAALKKNAQSLGESLLSRNIEARIFPKEARFVFSFLKDKASWQAESHIAMLLWEAPVPPAATQDKKAGSERPRSTAIFESTISLASPALYAEKCHQDIKAIAASRKGDPTWKEFVLRLKGLNVQQQEDYFKRQTASWRQEAVQNN